MKMLKREIADERTIITAEQTVLFFFKFKRKFITTRQSCPGYWDWLELPDKELVPDYISFQLDAWNREFYDSNN